MGGITAIVLSAGFSSRMKKFKLGLPFKNHTIIEEVLFQLSKTSIKEIILVTGHYKKSIEKLLATNSTIKISKSLIYLSDVFLNINYFHIQYGIRIFNTK